MTLDVINKSTNVRPWLIDARDFGAVRVARVLARPCSVTLARQHIADRSDLLSLVIGTRDATDTFQTDRLQNLAPIEMRMPETRSPAILPTSAHAPAWAVMMDRAPLEPLLSDVREPLRSNCATDKAALRMLTGYLETLFSLERTTDLDQDMAGRHLRELTLCAIGLNECADITSQDTEPRGTRLHAMLSRLSSEATEPGLDPAEFARRMGISVRYLHRLLEPTGKSFSEHLMGHRLAHAAAMLRDPACDIKIADIARLSGFTDISHFNRSFRRSFGDTPLGMRVRTNRKL